MAETNCGTVTLTEGELSEDDIELRDCSLSESNIGPGDSITAEVAVRNTNSTTGGEVTVAPTVDGTEVGEATVTLEAGETARIEADIPASEFAVGSNDVGWTTTGVESGGGGVSPPDQPIAEPEPIDEPSTEPIDLSSRERFR